TTALYYTKSGRSLQATGVEPDVVMEEPKVDIAALQPETPKVPQRLRESDLPGAFQNPSGKKDNTHKNQGAKIELPKVKPKNLETMEVSELLEEDPQLARALELLKTFNIFQGGFKKGSPETVAMK
ncbi:MAG: hypothetical protein KDD53_04445, partial [Bdellovibrionales bacterium]|nr:hypothetical protein [Bdellovibrionales bacterium]